MEVGRRLLSLDCGHTGFFREGSWQDVGLHAEASESAEKRNGSFWGKGGGGRRSLKEKGTFFREILSNQSSRESWDEEVLVL